VRGENYRHLGFSSGQSRHPIHVFAERRDRGLARTSAEHQTLSTLSHFRRLMALVRRRCFRSKWHTDEADAALTNSFPNLDVALLLSGHCAHPVWGLLLTFTSWDIAGQPLLPPLFLRDRPLSVPTSEIASFSQPLMAILLKIRHDRP